MTAPFARREPGACDARLAELLAAGPRDARQLLDLVDAWLGARRLVPNWGGLPVDERSGAVRACAAIHDQLRPMVAAGRLVERPLSPRQTQVAIYLWDRIFLNPLSAWNVSAGDRRAAGGDPLVRSLDAPLAEPAEPSPWRSGRPELERLLVALWMLNVPAHAVTGRDRERFVANAVAVCADAPALPLASAAPLAHALMVGAFRACYGGGDTAPALAAAGRFVASSTQRLFPRWSRPPAPRPPAPRLRVGYVSAFFRHHAVSSYMANRILARDRDRFHATVFALGAAADEVTAEIAASADELVRLPKGSSVAEQAARIAGADLDVLVFADIGMEISSYYLASLWLAPRQVALMGHATSTGLPTIGWYLSGDHEPPDAQAHYVERLVRLPHLGAAQRAPSPGRRRFRRAELGVPDDAVVLMNLGHGLKHGPDRDALYAEILARAPRAWLVLKPFFSPGDVDPRLVRRLRALGPRVTVLPPLVRPEDVHGLLACADVQLDSYPFGGWTTNLDALHAGLPIVTQEGALGRERWGARFLDLIGAEVGLARDARGYVEAAVRLATDDALRQAVAARVRARSRALFFDPLVTQAAYEQALTEIASQGSLPA
jgi:hypothetical protein